MLFDRLPVEHGRSGRWQDNVFVERLWRSVKYECVYLHANDSVAQARTSILQYVNHLVSTLRYS